jgi:outer membrane protein assembly factor BamB
MQRNVLFTRTHFPILVLAALLADGTWAQFEAAPPADTTLDYRTWTDSTGKYRTEAAMVDYADGKVHLRLRNGRTVLVPRTRLSAADQRYLREELKRRRTQPPPAEPSPTGPVTSAGDWPGWRGQRRDGKSSDTGLLKQWPATGPPLLWKIPGLGKGFSTVAVTGGTIYTSGDLGGQLMLLAYDLDGNPKWKMAHDAAWTKNHPGSRSTPVIDGDSLYIVSGHGKVGCYDAKSGQPKWTRHFREMGGSTPNWGYAESVLIVENLAVVTPGGENCIVALNKTNGQPVWSSKGFSAGAQYGSCIPALYQGVPMIVAGTHGGVVGVDARNGRALFSNPFSSGNTANCPDPAYADGHVFWANGYGKGGICLRLGATGGGVAAQQAWTTRDMVCHHGGYIIHEGHIYGNHSNGWACLDLKTGRPLWQDRGVGKGSLCYADGMLYLFSEDGGKAGLATCSPEGFELRGTFQVQGAGPSWAHPVVTGGRLYLRYDDNLYCFDVKDKGS